MNDEHPLKTYRDSLGLTMRALAKEIRASAASVSRIERGMQWPTQPLLHRIVHKTGVTADSLLRASRNITARL